MGYKYSEVPIDVLMAALSIALGKDNQNEINEISYALAVKLYPDCSDEEFQERLESLGYEKINEDNKENSHGLLSLKKRLGR